jgi:cbb3-type cytochrome oxidase subunit 1/cbb3-type cytochrome oxidase cytochrome c subunit/cytochrome c5
MSETAERAIDNRVDTLLVAAHGIAALIALLIAALFGIIISLQFFLPDLTGSVLPLGWGRLRYAHTQGVMLGWLGNAFLAFMYHAVPVLTGQAVTSRRLGLWLFGIWNFAVMVPGWILVLAGVSQPLEWAEFPLPVDAFVMIALGLAAIQFLPAFFRRGLETLYVSSWYIIGALVFTFMSFPMGNIVPELVPGAAGAAFSGLWIHDAVGLFVTPLALAILYFVIPASTGRPIFSHFLSMLGFWGLFFLYPLNGTHHYVYSVIPMAAQISAIAASALLAVIVVIVVTNLLMSMRGAGIFPRDIALRFVAMSTILYLVVSVQGGMQAQMSLQRAVHFTDWVVAHSHLAMLGFASFAAIGGLIHAWQRIPWARYNAAALSWAYSLLTIGIIAMFVDLTIAGLVQAELWLEGAPWLDSVRDSRPYWIVRTFSGLILTAGFVAVLIGLTTGPRGAGAQALDTGRTEASSAVTPRLVTAGAGAGRVLTMSYVVAGVAGVAFFAMSVTLLGVWPQRILADQTATMAPPNPLVLTIAEERGRLIYAREGCSYCHTQQIRYTDADIARFGAPTLAWETRFDFPHLWGTRRIGPDLARAGGTRTENWHYVHLYAPRSVSPLSIMPSYAALFDGSPDRPTQDARDLVAYLETLGRARELAWPEGDTAAAAAVPDDRWAQMAFDAPFLNAHPARTQPRGDVPALGSPASAETGRMLWAHNCAGCHGEAGGGDGPAAQWLRPRPTNLVEHEYARSRLADALWNGVHGSSMPAWREYAPADRAALADLVMSFSDPQQGPAPSAQQLARGQTVYTQHCASCHGPTGGGDGFAANHLPVPIAPTNFRSQRIAYEAGLRVVRNGIEGTSMAAWTQRLTDDQDIEAVVHYVRSLYEGGN